MSPHVHTFIFKFLDSFLYLQFDNADCSKSNALISVTVKLTLLHIYTLAMQYISNVFLCEIGKHIISKASVLKVKFSVNTHKGKKCCTVEWFIPRFHFYQCEEYF